MGEVDGSLTSNISSDQTSQDTMNIYDNNNGEYEKNVLNNEECDTETIKIAEISADTKGDTPCTACGMEIGYENVKRRKKLTALQCHKCNGYVHFACTHLPPYMLYTLSQTTKKYACEACVNTPACFLKEIIEGSLDRYDQPEAPNEIPKEHFQCEQKTTLTLGRAN